MNKRAKYIIFCLCTLSATFNLNAESFQRAEYYFGEDPGHGKATQIDISTDGNFTINTSISQLQLGVNRVFFRVMESGKWSQTTNRSIYRIGTELGYFNTEIIAGEYFWNSDPGYGNGTAINVTSLSDNGYCIITETISCKGLASEYNLLSMRVKTADGMWSITESVKVWIPVIGEKNIDALDYYWDDNYPGDAGGTALSFITLDDGSVAVIDYNLPFNDVSYGAHTLNIRALNAGRWTVIHSEDICVNANPDFSIYGGETVCEDNAIFVMNNTSNIQPETTFSWDMNGDGKADSTESSGMFTYTYTTAGVYNATLTVSHNGLCETTVTKTIIVNSTSAPTITLYADDTTVCAGTEVTFTTVIKNVNDTPIYTWYKNDVEIDGAEGDSYVTSDLINGDKIKVMITTTNSCASTNVATSSAKTITVYDMPEVTLTDLGIIYNDDAPFTLTNGSPTGGTYYIDGEVATYFAPMFNEDGDYTLEYVYTSSTGCTGVAETTIMLRDRDSGVTASSITEITSIYPNPVKVGESVIINGNFGTNVASDLIVTIYNASGVVVREFVPTSLPIVVTGITSVGANVVRVRCSDGSGEVLTGKFLVR